MTEYIDGPNGPRASNGAAYITFSFNAKTDGSDLDIWKAKTRKWLDDAIESYANRTDARVIEYRVRPATTVERYLGSGEKFVQSRARLVKTQ